MKLIFPKGLLFHSVILLFIVQLLRNVTRKSLGSKNTLKLEALRLPL